MKKLFSFLIVGIAACPAAHAAIVEAFSPPMGGMTVSVPAFSTQSVSLPLLHSSVGSGAIIGKISGVGSNYIDVTGANWVPGALSSASNPYYLRIKSGPSAGRMMLVSSTANTSTRVFISNDGIALTGAGGPVAGDAYELILADTLGSVFGSSTLQGGPNANSADNVWIWASTTWQIYYYNNIRNQWERTSDVTPTNRNNQVIRPDRGALLVRNAATDLKVYVTGRVPDAAARFFHSNSGLTFLSSGIPQSVTLGNLNLQTRVAGWTAGSNISTALAQADLIQVWASTTWLSYYYDSVQGYWRRTTDTGLTNRNTISIPAGRPVMIVRQGAASGGSLILMPSPPSS